MSDPRTTDGVAEAIARNRQQLLDDLEWLARQAGRFELPVVPLSGVTMPLRSAYEQVPLLAPPRHATEVLADLDAGRPLLPIVWFGVFGGNRDHSLVSSSRHPYAGVGVSMLSGVYKGCFLAVGRSHRVGRRDGELALRGEAPDGVSAEELLDRTLALAAHGGAR